MPNLSANFCQRKTLLWVLPPSFSYFPFFFFFSSEKKTISHCFATFTRIFRGALRHHHRKKVFLADKFMMQYYLYGALLLTLEESGVSRTGTDPLALTGCCKVSGMNFWLSSHYFPSGRKMASGGKNARATNQGSSRCRKVWNNFDSPRRKIFDGFSGWWMGNNLFSNKWESIHLNRQTVQETVLAILSNLGPSVWYVFQSITLI